MTQHDLFTDREEAIRLFEKQIVEHDTTTPWPLLPILSLVGPAGYGKSRFIRRLYWYHCNTPRHPRTSLDFSRADDLYDLLSILGTLRNNLRRQHDEQGHALKFPRFDIIYARLKRSEGQREEDWDEVDELFSDFSDLIGLVGNVNFILGLLLLLLKLIVQIPVVRSLVRWLVASGYERVRGRPEWRWYQDQVKTFAEFNLPADVPLPISALLSRFNEMCLGGGPEREFLIEQILPKAFLADLRYGSSDKEPWLRIGSSQQGQGPRRVVIFLDSFEVLMRHAESTAKDLLEALALNEYRKRGESDPLLLVVGSEVPLPDMLPRQVSQHFPPASDTRTIQERTDSLFNAWQQQLPPQNNRRVLRLRNIYLPLPFSPFSLDATGEYLLKLDQRDETNYFTDEALIEDIQRETEGYPVFLERVAVALRGDNMRNMQELFATGGHGEQIVDRLLALHCTPVEMRELMLSAMPRTLTQELLGRILNLSDDDARLRWQLYRDLPFLHMSEDRQRMTFLPGVRALFLRKLQLVTLHSNTTDYDRVHRLLRDYFNDRIKQEGPQDERNLMEYCYHSLALGDYEAVINLISIQQKRPDRWVRLFKVIEQAPTQRLPRTEVEREAEGALKQARLHRDVKEIVRAIVLYTWLLAAPGSEPWSISTLWRQLEGAYHYLQKSGLDAKGNMAAYCAQRAKAIHGNPVLSPTLRIPTQPMKVAQDASQPKVPLRQRMRRFGHSIYRGVRSSRRTQGVLTGVLACSMAFILVTWLLILPALAQLPAQPATDNPFQLPLAQLQPSAHNQWIGITVDSDKEYIGLSDGSIPFDYMRPDGKLKVQAASQLRSGHLAAAHDLFVQALQHDINDAEASIYLENTQIHLSGKSCTVFVVATRIAQDGGEGVNNGRDNMQGAYVAQKEYNDAQQGPPICLYVANIGNDPGTVARQIVQAATANKAIQGLIGWPGLLDNPASLNAVSQLEAAHMPIVSPDGYDEAQYVANVFHVTPSYQNEGRGAAVYAENLPYTARAVVMTDPMDPYSRSLTEGFKERFEHDGNLIVGIETYSTRDTDEKTLVTKLHNLLATHPDFLYFAGGPEKGQVLLAQLRVDAPQLHMFGGEELYPFVGFSANSRTDFAQLAFTSPAYPDTPTARHMQALYAVAFDPQDPERVRAYGYSRPDDRAILSYDAMRTLITADVNAAGVQSLQQALSSVRVEGASRTLITFTSLNELNDRSLFMLFVDSKKQIAYKII